MDTIKEIQERIVEEFSMYDEWLDKYEYLIELGKSLEPLEDSLKTEDRLIKGCQSRVWLDTNVQPDKTLVFRADSDAIITKGIISLLISVYSGHKSDEIAADDFSFIDRLGLRENLSPTRANGLASMIQTIRQTAEANL
ncbi:MAG: SufE family protein [Bacteroidales bacterium]|nr:SufE family protein [Bacteroidales bacterium]MDD6773241.1 SufE family protein [Bacteroidales bacterium]MDO4212774.1 SufE family protein [Bacteroidales bacterium]